MRIIHVFSVNVDKMCDECNYAAVFVNMFCSELSDYWLSIYKTLKEIFDLDVSVTL